MKGGAVAFATIDEVFSDFAISWFFGKRTKIERMIYLRESIWQVAEEDSRGDSGGKR
jgi:hypothetical protein